MLGETKEASEIATNQLAEAWGFSQAKHPYTATPQEVERIRLLHCQGVPMPDIARQVHLSESTVRKVLRLKRKARLG
jgi:DNA-binding NarL/FixJ family response regulator